MSNDVQIFDIWNEEKKRIHNKPVVAYVNEREVWYCKLGINVGFEQNGKYDFRRPVLVLKKVGAMFLVCPLSTKGKHNSFYHQINQLIGGKISWCLLSQIRVVDKKRLLHLVDTVTYEEFAIIKKILRNMYFQGLDC